MVLLKSIPVLSGVQQLKSWGFGAGQNQGGKTNQKKDVFILLWKLL